MTFTAPVEETPKIVLSRKLFRLMGLRGPKHPVFRTGFIGPDGRPRLWMSHVSPEKGPIDDSAN